MRHAASSEMGGNNLYRPLGREVRLFEHPQYKYICKSDCFSSCITIAGGFVSYCRGYTVGYKDIDVFCTRSFNRWLDYIQFYPRAAFAKFVERAGEAEPGIRLVRLLIICSGFHRICFVSLTPESFNDSTYWEHNFSVYNVYSEGELTKVQVKPYAQTLTFPLR